MPLICPMWCSTGFWCASARHRLLSNPSLVAPMYRGERFNSISHLVGAVLALGGGTILMIRGAWSGNPWKIVSFTIYSVTAVLLYLASTIYHSTRGKAKAVWNKLDYCAIYLLIAG